MSEVEPGGEREVLAALRSSLPWFREQSEEAARARRLPEATVARIRDLGLMRLLQPARHGGFEAPPEAFVLAMLELSAACSAAGWVLGVVGVHHYHLGLYEDRLQAEVWGEDADTWISSSYAPSGTADRVEGGFVLRGRWSFSSGSDHCRWAFVGGMAVDGQGGPPEYRHFVLPRSDYEIEDVWNVSGLSGTGSNDIVVDDVFVPEYRTMSVADLAALRCPGRRENTGPLFSCPWGAVFLNAVCVPLVGMAQAVLDECITYHRSKIGDGGNRLAMPHPVTLARLAEASSDIDAARLSLLANVREVYDWAVREGEVPLAVRTRARRDQAVAVTRAMAAADAGYYSAGPRAISLQSPIQRIWRDVHAGAHHAVNLPDLGLAGYGGFLLTGRMEDPLV